MIHCESCDSPATRKDACGTALCGRCWSADEDPRPIPLDATEEEQAFFEVMAQYCKCRSGDCPCDGVLAGGICDDVQDRDEPDYDAPRPLSALENWQRTTSIT